MSQNRALGVTLVGEEVLELLKQAAALSVQAEIALNAGDAEEVFHLLQRRSALLYGSEAALAILREAAGGPPHQLKGVGAELVASVISTARSLEAGDARLALALETERDRLARELDQIESDGAVRSAYGKQTREQAKINIVR